MLANRFDILLDADFAQTIYMIKKESLEAMEFQRIQIMRQKGENEAREARERQGTNEAEEFDVGTEASWNLEEDTESPDYMPPVIDPKGPAKGKGKGRARGGGYTDTGRGVGPMTSSSSSSTQDGYRPNEWLSVELRTG